METNKLGYLYMDGEVIVKQGTVSNCLYVIQEGKVEVIEEIDELELKIAELGESEFFGEMGLFENEVRSCTVRAVGEAKILTIDKKNFLKSIEKDPSIAYRLLERMSHRLRETNKKISRSNVPL
jgi:CRP/FNR family transcriptional regulator, cyclic AMP receptor protein